MKTGNGVAGRQIVWERFALQRRASLLTTTSRLPQLHMVTSFLSYKIPAQTLQALESVLD